MNGTPTDGVPADLLALCNELRAHRFSSARHQNGSGAADNARRSSPRIPADNDFRSRQSLSSIINDPTRSRGITGAIKDLMEPREMETPATDLVYDAILGLIPQLADFQAYLDGFGDAWDVYEQNHRPKRRMKSTDEDTDSTWQSAQRAIPSVYFQQDFTLARSPIFEDIRATVGNQEKFNTDLSGYLDVVEASLFRSVQLAQQANTFESFVAAGESMVGDVNKALAVVRVLRSRFKSVQRSQVRHGLRAAQLARRRARMTEVLRLLDGCSQMQQVENSFEALVRSQDYNSALALLENSTDALAGDLSEFAGVEFWCARLARLGRTLDLSMQADFAQASADAILGVTDGHGLGASEPPNADSLRHLCLCLLRRRELKSILGSALCDKLLADLKAVLRSQSKKILQGLAQTGTGCPEALPAASVEHSQGPHPVPDDPAAPAQNGTAQAPREAPVGVGEISTTRDFSASLCALDYDGFLAFWRRTLQNCVDIAGSFSAYAALIHSTARAPPGPGEGLASAAGVPATGSADPHAGADVSAELLHLFEQLTGSLLQKVSVFLQARQHRHQALRWTDWRQLAAATDRSLHEIEVLHTHHLGRLAPDEPAAAARARPDICGGLRGTLRTQTRLVVEAFHQQSLAQVQSSLEQERWERIDVPQAYKQLLGHLLGGGERPEAAQAAGADSQEPDKHIRVGGTKFLAVPAILVLIQVLHEYVQLSHEWGSCARDIALGMVYLLRHFNQQVHKMVLGGHAVHSQTLKKITAMHLGICCQCCVFMERLLPSLQQLLCAVLEKQGAPGGESPLAEVADGFAKVAAEYADHRQALLNKLSDLLCLSFKSHANRWLGAAHAELRADVASQLAGASDGSGRVAEGVDLHPHAAMEGIVRDVAGMHTVLQKLLGVDHVKKVFVKAFSDIAAMFGQQLEGGLAAPSPPYSDKLGSSLGDRLAMDIAFLQDQLGKKLAGITTPLGHLLADLLHHLQTKLPEDDPVRHLHRPVLEALRRLGKLPQ